MANDSRVQAIRCSGCHRLRPIPRTGRPECMCGAWEFFPSFPMPGEENWAMQIYKDELDKKEPWKHSLTP